MDPLNPELQRLASPLYQQVVKARDEVDRSLLERGKELEAAGYHQQVKVTPSSTLLFLEIDGARTPLRRVNGNFAAGEKRYSETELINYINTSPETVSGNALLRPIIQDYLLPTVAYVGGPAEVAYFAQAGVVYQKLLGRVTPIIPRLSTTLLDARDQRLLAEYGLTLRDVIERDAKLGEFLAARRLDNDMEKAFANVGRLVEEQIGGLEKQLKQFDATLADAAKHSRSKIQYQLSRLRGRAANALLRRNQELGRHAESLRKSLFPNGELQERQIAGISYLARFGEDLLTRLESAARGGCNGHHVVRM
jgi:bacillithiol biosynthesis cysteine-adding enzyme BshC